MISLGKEKLVNKYRDLEEMEFRKLRRLEKREVREILGTGAFERVLSELEEREKLGKKNRALSGLDI